VVAAAQYTTAVRQRTQEVRAASVIEVNTVGMQALAMRMLHDVGRQDVTVALRPPRVTQLPPAHRV
jgi:hypothetical protein